MLSIVGRDVGERNAVRSPILGATVSRCSWHFDVRLGDAQLNSRPALGSDTLSSVQARGFDVTEPPVPPPASEPGSF